MDTKRREDLTPPDDTWVKFVCKIGAGAECCKYLTMSAGAGAGWSCEKHTSLAATIDEKARTGKFTAISDNCEGRGERR